MANYSRFILLLGALYTFMGCSNRITLNRLKSQIEDKLATQKGDFAVAFKDITTGDELQIKGNTFFHAASTMKTPVMIEVYKQIAAGKLSLSDSLVIKNEFRSIVDSSVFSLNSKDDSEQELYNHLGEKRSLYDLVYAMIIKSSNLATNMVIELTDARKVTQTMRQLGANHIQVLRGVEDSKAFAKGLNNITTSEDLMIIYEKMAKGQVIDSASSQAMINILLDQQFNDIIPAQLPKTVKVAHKTGSISQIHHDSGIILLPDGRKYVLVLLSKNWVKEEDAIKAMADISALVYQFETTGE